MLTATAPTLVLTRAGRLSLDHGRSRDRARVRFALAAGAAVVGLVTVFAH